jgi:hypothetical protein
MHVRRRSKATNAWIVALVGMPACIASLIANTEGIIMASNFVARYQGICADTGALIRPGDLITMRGRRPVLVSHASNDSSVSDVIRTSGGTFYRNKNGRCIDAPCCGCCTI